MNSNYVDLDSYMNYSDPVTYRAVSYSEIYTQYSFEVRNYQYFSNTHWITII